MYEHTNSAESAPFDMDSADKLTAPVQLWTHKHALTYNPTEQLIDLFHWVASERGSWA